MSRVEELLEEILLELRFAKRDTDVTERRIFQDTSNSTAFFPMVFPVVMYDLDDKILRNIRAIP